MKVFLFLAVTFLAANFSSANVISDSWYARMCHEYFKPGDWGFRLPKSDFDPSNCPLSSSACSPYSKNPRCWQRGGTCSRPLNGLSYVITSIQHYEGGATCTAVKTGRRHPPADSRHPYYRTPKTVRFECGDKDLYIDDRVILNVHFSPGPSKIGRCRTRVEFVEKVEN